MFDLTLCYYHHESHYLEEKTLLFHVALGHRNSVASPVFMGAFMDFPK